MKCPQCPYYEQKTSYGTELIKCNNEECQYNRIEPQESEDKEVKSTIIVKTEQGYVKKVMAEFTPSDYLVVSKALKLLSENEEVHEIDRGRARELHEIGFKAEIGQALADTPTVKAVPIKKINNLINDIEVLRTDPTIIDNDDVQRFAENVLYALNNLIKEGK